MGRGEGGGSNELLYVGGGWVGGWVGRSLTCIGDEGGGPYPIDFEACGSGWVGGWVEEEEERV